MLRKRGRSEEGQVKIGSELHLEVAVRVLLLCGCSHLSLKPLLIICIHIKNGQGIANLARKCHFGKSRSIGKLNSNLIISRVIKGANIFHSVETFILNLRSI